MEEHTPDPVDANLGISRRTLLRRGAVVGGTLIWAAPTIRTLGTPAFASGSPRPGGPGVSYIAVVVRCDDGNWYRAKWEADGTFWEASPGPPFPDDETDCYPTPEYTRTESKDMKGDDEGLVVTPGAHESEATLFVPEVLTGKGCTVLEVKATAKGASDACDRESATVTTGSGGVSIRFDL